MTHPYRSRVNEARMIRNLRLKRRIAIQRIRYHETLVRLARLQFAKGEISLERTIESINGSDAWIADCRDQIVRASRSIAILTKRV